MKLKLSWEFYLMLLAVIAVSFTSAWLLPVSDTFKDTSTLPGVGALLAAIFQIFRDKLSHERQEELQREQLSFNLSVTSHMAIVLFDKHVEFCEKYIRKMDEGLHKLFVEGPTDYALSLARELSEIRSGYRTWLTEDISTKILAYENALMEIGRLEKLSEHTRSEKTAIEALDKMWGIFMNVTGIKDAETSIDEQIVHESIITHLQQVLGIRELTKLRQKVIAEAIESISSRET